MKSFTIKSTILAIAAIFSVSFCQPAPVTQVLINAPANGGWGSYIGLCTGYYILGVTNLSAQTTFNMLGLDNANNVSLNSPNSLSINAFWISISGTNGIRVSGPYYDFSNQCALSNVPSITVGNMYFNATRKIDVTNGDIRIRGTTSFSNPYVSGQPFTDSACIFFGDEYHWIKARRGLGVQIGSFYSPDGNASSSKAGLTVHQAITTGGPCFVGINCSNPRSELTVAGTITAQAITVTLSGSWSDFVFKNNYNLKPLGEVENYIKANNHLEGIPSEKEVKANGVDLEKIQAKLLQKVEELTLYAIDQNKKIEALAKDNEVLMKKLKSAN
jgi:hypothetical protein